MKLTTDELGELYRERTARGADRSDCPPAEALGRVSTGDLPADERLALVDHLAACSDCADEYRVARSAVDLVGRQAPAAPTVVPLRPRVAGVRLLAIAAALVLALALGLQWALAPLDPRPPVRGPELAGPRFEPADRAALDGPPERLVWERAPRAEAYTVTVYDAESTPLWESPALAGPPAELPAGLRERLAAGGTFYWRVVTVEGVERRSSPLMRFTVRARP